MKSRSMTRTEMENGAARDVCFPATLNTRTSSRAHPGWRISTIQGQIAAVAASARLFFAAFIGNSIESHHHRNDFETIALDRWENEGGRMCRRDEEFRSLEERGLGSAKR